MTIYTYQDFLQTASETLLEVNKDHQHSAIIVLNLEGLPELDGVLGYTEVDEILVELVQQLRDALNTNDLVGPTGRYQISSLLTDLLTSNHAILAAHKILRTFAKPFLFKGRNIALLPRIGVAVNNSDENLKQLMSNASTAIHQAKINREPIQLFDEKEKDWLLSGIDIWTELDHAIETGDLHLVYQPQLLMNTGKIKSTEALLRWNHPTRGMIPPDKLIAVAEGTELMTKLTLWVFNTALRQCADYRKAGLDAGVSLNLSADDLCDTELVDSFEQFIDIWRVPPSDIMVELTETAVMEYHPGSLETLHALKKIGVQLAMDDFGTGYSSMERLLRLPLDEIKIDMMFIKDMLAQPTYERIVDSMINMGHQLGLHVIAEGVEDLATFERLQALGCDTAQGYFVAQGVPYEELIKTAESIANNFKK